MNISTPLTTAIENPVTVTDSANLASLYFELRDAGGNRDRVLLTGITNSEQRFQIDPELFNDVDISKIVEFGFVVEGKNTGKKSNNSIKR